MDLSKLKIFGKEYNFKDVSARENIDKNAKNISQTDAKVNETNESVSGLKKLMNSFSEKISKLKGVIVSSEAPTDENVELWINTNETENFSIPEIKDDLTNELDTWSSKKINSELTSLENKTTKNLAGKVDKVDGKALSSNDYTTEEKIKLASLKNYDDTEIKKSIGTIGENLKTLSDTAVTIDIMNDLTKNTPHVNTISQ